MGGDRVLGEFPATAALIRRAGDRPAPATLARAVTETLGTGRWRSRQEILDYFGDLELIEPGLVPLAGWRPNRGAIRHPEAVNVSFIGGVARKG